MEQFDEPSHFDGKAYGIIIAGHFQVDDTYMTSRPHGMDDWLIAFTLNGRGYFKVDGAERVCGEGDIALLRPDTAHAYGTVKGESWNFVWAHFTSRSVGDQLLPVEPLSVHSFEQSSLRSRIDQAFRRILSDSRERSELWHELCANSLREILMLLSQLRKQKLDPRVAEALHYLSLNMRSPVQIAKLAKMIGISPSRLSHLFKEQTGLSIIDTLNQMRIRQAALLLEHTNRSASEVAYDVGFNNYNHFIEQFRKWLGTNPSGYRKASKSPSLS
ncbi:DNA-binding transcriptional regulator AraC [Paenibacillus montaniterrae]|uniref:DNA-binding transcriptional regulator AraC n=1 Tax=Paenibacillus montaniterrae TaxID=429341 RepID=A0A919YQW5_9BACL|nr:helix-turn-helix domain-containing protein [Paenibacillus montaniterrae]GIP16649.1 DNA-binding transcriptional regulator AraC [Paenibacillus montaniterrae]